MFLFKYVIVVIVTVIMLDHYMLLLSLSNLFLPKPAKLPKTDPNSARERYEQSYGSGKTSFASMIFELCHHEANLMRSINQKRCLIPKFGG